MIARRWLPGDGGHAPLDGLGGAPTPVSHAPGVVLAAIGTLGFGAVLGPEAPVIALGSALGMAVLLVVRTGPLGTAVLSTAGSFSAMSALFGGPLVAGMLLVEAGLEVGKRLLWILLPGLVSAAVGYVIFIGLGDWGGLDARRPHGARPAAVRGDARARPPRRRSSSGSPPRSSCRRPTARRPPSRASGAARHAGVPARGRPRGRPARAARRRPRRDAQEILFSGPGLGARGGGRGLHVGAGGHHRRQVPRVRRQPRLRLPRRADLPGHLPRHRPRLARGGLVRRLADVRHRGGRGGGHGGAGAAADRAAPLRGAARRERGPRRDPRGRARRRRRPGWASSSWIARPTPAGITPP